MLYPELIFIFIFLVTTVYITRVFIENKKTKKMKLLITKIMLSTFIIGFSFIWFVPIYIGQKGEAPICKFRLKVYSFETDDYGTNGTINDLFFKIKPNKYGNMHFILEEGGWQEYFGLKPM